MTDAPDRGPVHCWIYRGGLRRDTYLFVPGPDAFNRVPAALLSGLGQLELAMELELYPGRRLARADAADVLRALDAQGYYLQLPPVDRPAGTPIQ